MDLPPDIAGWSGAILADAFVNLRVLGGCAFGEPMPAQRAKLDAHLWRIGQPSQFRKGVVGRRFAFKVTLGWVFC